MAWAKCSMNSAKIPIYGIKRLLSSSDPAWERTDNAVGFTATASVGTVAGSSSFDKIMPWAGITRETLSTGDVMVKIPKFWFRRYIAENEEHIEIAGEAVKGFTLHPAFNHGDTPKNCVYVGAYKTSSGYKSLSGASPLTNQTRATVRTNAKAKGAGWGLLDVSALSAIQMLILVEFANNNVQALIGRGNCDSNTICKTGTCDNVINLTGRPAGSNGKVDIVWRGIEGFWANIWEWVDGVNWDHNTYYVCNNPSNYADDTATNYTALSFNGTYWNNSYITSVGLDTGTNNHVILPSIAKNGSENTYECDGCWSWDAWCVCTHGGDSSNESLCGLFSTGTHLVSSRTDTMYGSRLLYIPS